MNNVRMKLIVFMRRHMPLSAVYSAQKHAAWTLGLTNVLLFRCLFVSGE